jgi:hypothetical protein
MRNRCFLFGIRIKPNLSETALVGAFVTRIFPALAVEKIAPILDDPDDPISVNVSYNYPK